jgi:hypothetical protein
VQRAALETAAAQDRYMLTADQCWALDLLAAPMRARWAYVSARCNLLDAHLSALRTELQGALDGTQPVDRALARMGHLRAVLDLVERRVVALDAVRATPRPR